MNTPQTPMRLLLVDDEAVIRTSLGMVFEDDGWKVTTVDSGESAADVYEPGQFDLVLTDKNMPGMSGIDLVATIRERDENVALIMLTGYGSEDSAIATLNLGIDAYVEKPVRDALALTVRARAIVAKRSEQDLATADSEAEIRALLLCPDETRQRMLFADLSERVDHVDLADDLSAAKSRLADGIHRLVLITQETPELVDAVQWIKAENPRSSVAVVAQALGLPVILKLMEIGVTAIIDQPVGTKPCAARLAQIVNHVRQRG